MSDFRDALRTCFVDGCVEPVWHRFRCKEHQQCAECGAPHSHYRDCPKVDAGRMETT